MRILVAEDNIVTGLSSGADENRHNVEDYISSHSDIRNLIIAL